MAGAQPRRDDRVALKGLTTESPVTAPVYRRLRRLHALMAIVPVGAFLVAHFTINAIAVQGPEAFNRAAQRLSSLPGLGWIEFFLIGVPLAVHGALGAFLANAEQALSDLHRYPSRWMPLIQRATGGYLAVFVVFHVWSTRLAPAFNDPRADWFGLMRNQLQNPAIFSFYALAVVAASAHMALGVMALAAPGETPLRPPDRARLWGLGIAAFALLVTVGLGAMIAFVVETAP